MKVIYIAGPYTAKTNWEVQQNINRAMEAGKLVAEMGAMPLIPHSNTPLIFEGIQNPQFWYDGTMEFLRRSDAILLIEGWENSVGAVTERDEAINIRIPIFYRNEHRSEIDYMDAMKLWIKGILAFPPKRLVNV